MGVVVAVAALVGLEGWLGTDENGNRPRAAAVGQQASGDQGNDAEAGEQDVTTVLQLRSGDLDRAVPSAVQRLVRTQRNDVSGASLDHPRLATQRSCRFAGLDPAFTHAVTLDGRPAALVVPAPQRGVVHAVLQPCQGNARTFDVPQR